MHLSLGGGRGSKERQARGGTGGSLLVVVQGLQAEQGSKKDSIRQGLRKEPGVTR